MKNLTIVFILFLASNSISAQFYTVDTFRREYVELTHYKSIALETMGDLFWGKRFEFPFLFPYYDTLYNHINFDSGCSGIFDGSIDYNLLIFTFGYQFDNVLDTVNIESDVRYGYYKSGTKEWLCIQFTKNRIDGDPSVELYDSYVNFQLYLYNNGDIELQFGDMNLDHSPVYVEGKGFYLIQSNGTRTLFGPTFGIKSPFDKNEETFVNGKWNDYKVGSLTNYLTSLPEKGFVFRFRNNLVHTTENNSLSRKIYPNPSSGIYYLEGKYDHIKVLVKDMQGKVVHSTILDGQMLDISHLTPGMYFIETTNSETKFINKVIKI